MARTAVLIHGMSGTSDVWRNWRQFFEERGWQTIVHSLRHPRCPRGCNLSSRFGHWAETSLHDCVSDLIDDGILSLPKKPVVIGHSMGRAASPPPVRQRPRTGRRAAFLLLRPRAVVAIEAVGSDGFAPHPDALKLVAQAAQSDTQRSGLSYTFNTSDLVMGT